MAWDHTAQIVAGPKTQEAPLFSYSIMCCVSALMENGHLGFPTRIARLTDRKNPPVILSSIVVVGNPAKTHQPLA